MLHHGRLSRTIYRPPLQISEYRTRAAIYGRVTTNFDKCFENATGALGCKASVFVSPALPLGGDIDGIVHLHGVFDDSRSMILTAEDYGRAYVSNGWALRFLVDLFKATRFYLWVIAVEIPC